MATSTRLGGHGRFNADRHRDLHGVPGAGDAAPIADGEVSRHRQGVAATLDLPQPPCPPLASATEHGTLGVSGPGSIGAIDLNLIASHDIDDPSHPLFNGATAVGQPRFTPGITAASFGSGYASIGVARTADGVFLRGLGLVDPPDATGIPARGWAATAPLPAPCPPVTGRASLETLYFHARTAQYCPTTSEMT